MSPRAAWRLEALGFAQVFDYVAGKVDWGAAGLPYEGSLAERPTAADAADPDVPTCSLDDDLVAVRERVRASGWETCIVLNSERIVLGRLGRSALRSDEPSTVEATMTEGPSTVRPSSPLQDLVERMVQGNQSTALVTTSEGRLVGLVKREEAEQTLTV